MEKVSAASIFGSLVSLAEQNNPPRNGDYLDSEGFLMCGRCHTRKQCEVTIPAGLFGTEAQVMKVPTTCACRRAEIEHEEEEERKNREMETLQKFRMDVIQRFHKEGLMDEEFREATLENFRKDKHNAYNLKLIRWYSTHFEEMAAKNQGLLFYGDVGFVK